MGALFFAMAGVDWPPRRCLYVGLVLVLGSTAQYVREAVGSSRGEPSSSA